MNIVRKVLVVAAGVAVLTMANVLAAPPAYAAANICGSSGPRCTKFVQDYINPFMLLLTGLVGVLAVISLVMAGIQYSSSADDPGAVTKAKQRMFNTVIGILAYIFLYAFLNYLIPNGIPG